MLIVIWAFSITFQFFLKQKVSGVILDMYFLWSATYHQDGEIDWKKIQLKKLYRLITVMKECETAEDLNDREKIVYGVSITSLNFPLHFLYLFIVTYNLVMFVKYCTNFYFELQIKTRLIWSLIKSLVNTNHLVKLR